MEEDDQEPFLISVEGIMEAWLEMLLFSVNSALCEMADGDWSVRSEQPLRVLWLRSGF